MSRGRQIEVVEIGKRFGVVDRHLWDIEKTTGNMTIYARSGIISVHDTRTEAERACAEARSQLSD